jgi:membrane-associated phospholipid phosphatase
MKSRLLPVLIVALFSREAFAQHLQDSLPIVAQAPAAARPLFKPGTLPVGNDRLPSSMLILPTTFVVYGFAALKNNYLHELNEEVKDELWLEHTHRPNHIDNYLQWTPAVAVFSLSAMGVKGKHNIREQAILYGLSTAIMSATVFATKNISAELRPDASNNKSFPSGHTANAFAAAEFLRKEYQGVSPWIGVAGYGVATLTGYLRMYNNKHWFSDVVTGAGVGILSTNLAYYIYPRIKRPFSGKDGNPTIAMPYYQGGVGGSAGLMLVKQF